VEIREEVRKMNKCQIHIEAWELGQSDQLDQEVFDLDEESILNALMWMRDLSAEHGHKMSHFDVQIVCDGNFYDSTSLPPLMKDYGGL